MDKDQTAGETWRKNFPEGVHFEKLAHEWVVIPDPLRRSTVDILHLSPPCQFFSPNKTRAGKDDFQNYVILFSLGEILKKARPSMFTLEQTFGLLHPKFTQAFNTLVQAFTELGFSISWQILDFRNYGLCQSRRRLIIFGAWYAFTPVLR